MDKNQALATCPGLATALEREPGLGTVFEQLAAHDLLGVFARYLPDASADSVARFLSHCRSLDYRHLQRHRRALRQPVSGRLGADDVAPVDMVTLQQQQLRRQRDREAGRRSLEQGRWATIAFAGGAGTRFFSGLARLAGALDAPNERLRGLELSADLPKGVFPISPVAGLSFYELTIGHALAAGLACGRLPVIMFLTSSATHRQTVEFFSRVNLWGLPPGQLVAFRQHDIPRLDENGDLIVTDRQGNISTTGDGHGGVFRALLDTAGDGPCLAERLAELGVEQLVMHNVDNAAARPLQEVRLGFHVNEQALFTLSAVRKERPEEKVGVLMLRADSGRVEVIEYNVLDEGLCALRQPDGRRLLHEAGNANTNLVALSAISADIEPTLYTGKMVPSLIGPVAGSSLEMLNQHLTRRLPPERVRAYEIDRAELFMPTKNITGPDSVQTTTRALSRQGARRLGEAGARVHDSALVDLHPGCAGSAELVNLGVGPGWRLEQGSRLYLCAGGGGQPPLSAGGLVLEPGASLLIFSELPWGRLEIAADRSIRRQPEDASRVQLGKGVRVARGSKVVIRAAAGSRVSVPDGHVFSADAVIVAEPGRSVDL